MRTSTRALFALVPLLALLASWPASAAPQGQVNINSASAEQLQLLPRIGPSVAARIIEFRDSNGRFKTLEDLMLVRGVGEKTFEQLKPYLTLSGDTTLTEKVRTRGSGDADGEDN